MSAHQLQLKIWIKEHKDKLSLFSQQKAEDMLTELTTEKKSSREISEQFALNLIKHINQRIIALEDAKEIYSKEIEKMSFHHRQYSSKIELLSEMQEELDTIYISLIQELTVNGHALHEIESVLEIIKRVTHFSLSEMNESKGSEPENLRFNFINHLKILLYTKGEGVNALIESLREDTSIISSTFKPKN